MSTTNPGGTKPKPKQAKSQQLIALQHRMQQLVKQNFEQSITIKKLTHQLSTIKQFQLVQSAQYQKQTHQHAQTMQKMQLIRAAQEEHLMKLRERKEQLEIDNGCLVYKLEKLTKDYDENMRLARQQMDEMKRGYEAQMKRYQLTASEYQLAIDERKHYMSLNQQLQKQLQQSLQQYTLTIADKDRQKLQTVDFMKKDMYQKAKQMKSTLLTMRRQQMSTNARLTVLQNQQLLEQLEYQSKHTEKMLKKNQLLQKEVGQLKKQLEIEKEINCQLAKRTTLAKKIIANININGNGNNNGNNNGSNNGSNNNDNNNNDNNNNHPSQQQPLPSSQQSQSTVQSLKKSLNDKSNQILILQSQLNKQSKSMQKTKSQLQRIKRLYEQILPKYQAYLDRQGDLKHIMVRYLKCLLEGEGQEQQKQQKQKQKQKQKQQQQQQNKAQNDNGSEIRYDITRLKDTPIEQWTKSDIQITIKMLLTFIKPFFTMKHMKAQYFKFSLNNNNLSNKISNHHWQQQKLLSQKNINNNNNNNTNNSNKFSIKGRKSLSTLQLISPDNNYYDYHYRNNNNINIGDKQQKHRQYPQYKSTNISPQKKNKTKQFSLNSILQDIKQKQIKQKQLKSKSKSKNKLRSQSKTIKKSFSQHTLSNINHVQQQSINSNNNNNNSNKLQIIVSHKRQQHTQAAVEFNPDNFRANKQSNNNNNNKLVKSNYRQWGQKVNLRPRGSFIVDKKVQ